MIGFSRGRLVGMAAPLVGLGAILWALVSYGKACVERDAVWVGFSFDRGVALVYRCGPNSGIKRAFFYVWPWKKVELEKQDSGAQLGVPNRASLC